MQEKMVFLALDYRTQLEVPENEVEKDYELPSGQVIKTGRERFKSVFILDYRDHSDYQEGALSPYSTHLC